MKETIVTVYSINKVLLISAQLYKCGVVGKDNFGEKYLEFRD